MPDKKEKKYKIKASNIEDIDKAMYFYINETLNLHTDTNKGFEKTPVIWVGAERAFQIKNDVDLRNKIENTNPQSVLDGNIDQFIEEGIKNKR